MGTTVTADRIHVVLGGELALVTLGEAHHRVVLPNNSVSTTRWLSDGLDLGDGWPRRLENHLEDAGGVQVVLNLARSGLTVAGVCDELSMQFRWGFPAIAQAYEEVRTRLIPSGAKPVPGALIFAFGEEIPPKLVKKLESWAVKNHWKPIFVRAVASPHEFSEIVVPAVGASEDEIQAFLLALRMQCLPPEPNGQSLPGM
jgi:hypothetical protein